MVACQAVQVVLDAVDHRRDAELLVIGAALGVALGVAVKRGGQTLVGGGIRQQVAGELLDGELVEWHVRVERADHPVAVGPDIAVRILFETVGVRIARQVQPDGGPALAETRRCQQTVDHPPARGFRVRRQVGLESG